MAVNNRRRALERQMKPKRIVREPEACSRLGCRRTKFRTDYRLGPRNIGYLDAEIDELIDAELRDAVTRYHGAAGRD